MDRETEDHAIEERTTIVAVGDIKRLPNSEKVDSKMVCPTGEDIKGVNVATALPNAALLRGFEES